MANVILENETAVNTAEVLVEETYTSLSAGDSALIAVSGLFTVFVLLLFLQLAVTYISKVVMKADERVEAKKAEEQKKSRKTKKVSSNSFNGDVILKDVDEKTAACIIAIVCEESGIPLSELVVKRISAI